MAIKQQSFSTGIFTISLDFEMYWGMREMVSLEDAAFRRRLEGVYKVIPGILELFQTYNIQATWAVVGFLHCNNSQALQAKLPSKRPQYQNQELSPYTDAQTFDSHAEQYKFCPELIELIRATPGQEIGTHTFSHYYCLESGQSEAEFRADLQAAIDIAKEANLKLESLVFPRNQCNDSYLNTVSELGLTNYRGNESNWLHDWDHGRGNSINRRLLRLLDTYFPVTGKNCYSLEQLKSTYPVNIPSSRFLKPYSATLKSLDPLRLKRITDELDYAAQEGLVYHLWWHPHNFGVNLAENLNFLERILKHYQRLNEKHNMQSLNMGKIAKLCVQTPFPMVEHLLVQGIK